MSSWHAVEQWSTKKSEPAYSQRRLFSDPPCGKNVYTDFTCPCWRCKSIKWTPKKEFTHNVVKRRYKRAMEKKAATKIQGVWRGFLVRNPTGIPTKEFYESFR